MLKVCRRCEFTSPISEFYKHSKMADGHLNICKVCKRKQSMETRNSRLEYYRAYDRERYGRQASDYHRQYKAKYPNRYKAREIVRGAIRSGKLFSEPCCECGKKKTVAHHDDYLKPLNVRWLCPAHRNQWRVHHGEGKNG